MQIRKLKVKTHPDRRFHPLTVHALGRPRQSALELAAEAIRSVPGLIRLGARRARFYGALSGSTGFSPTRGRVGGEIVDYKFLFEYNDEKAPRQWRPHHSCRSFDHFRSPDLPPFAHYNDEYQANPVSVNKVCASTQPELYNCTDSDTT